jgi:hypothetical protein
MGDCVHELERHPTSRAASDDCGWHVCTRCGWIRERWVDQGVLRGEGFVDYVDRWWAPLAGEILREDATVDGLVRAAREVPCSPSIAGVFMRRVTLETAQALLERLSEMSPEWSSAVRADLERQTKRARNERAFQAKRSDPSYQLSEACRRLARPAPAAALAVVMRGADTEALVRQRQNTHLETVELLVRGGLRLSGPQSKLLITAARDHGQGDFCRRIARLLSDELEQRGLDVHGRDELGIRHRRFGAPLALMVPWRAHAIQTCMLDTSETATGQYDDLDGAIEAYDEIVRRLNGGPGPYR